MSILAEETAHLFLPPFSVEVNPFEFAPLREFKTTALRKAKLYTVLALLSAIGLNSVMVNEYTCRGNSSFFASLFSRGQPFQVGSSKRLTLLHSERPKLYTISAFLSAIGLTVDFISTSYLTQTGTQKFMEVNIRLFSRKRLY